MNTRIIFWGVKGGRCVVLTKLPSSFVNCHEIWEPQPPRTLEASPDLYEGSFISNPLNAKLNLICHLLALLGAHHILHVSRVWVNFYLYVHYQHRVKKLGLTYFKCSPITLFSTLILCRGTSIA